MALWTRTQTAPTDTRIPGDAVVKTIKTATGNLKRCREDSLAQHIHNFIAQIRTEATYTLPAQAHHESDNLAIETTFGAARNSHSPEALSTT